MRSTLEVSSARQNEATWISTTIAKTKILVRFSEINQNFGFCEKSTFKVWYTLSGVQGSHMTHMRSLTEHHFYGCRTLPNQQDSTPDGIWSHWHRNRIADGFRTHYVHWLVVKARNWKIASKIVYHGKSKLIYFIMCVLMGDSKGLWCRNKWFYWVLQNLEYDSIFSHMPEQIVHFWIHETCSNGDIHILLIEMYYRGVELSDCKSFLWVLGLLASRMWIVPPKP